MPPSWVPALAISRERLDVRCPKGSKRALYRQCQREIFARFGECARWDGLVERYTLYEVQAPAGARLGALALECAALRCCAVGRRIKLWQPATAWKFRGRLHLLAPPP